MLNDYIGGGQVFAHKVRMFMQVFWQSARVSILLGGVLSLVIYVPQLLKEDIQAAISYRKAVLVDGFDEAISSLRPSNPRSVTAIDVRTRAGVYATSISPRKVMSLKIFKEADLAIIGLLISLLRFAALASFGAFLVVFFLWRRFGEAIKDDKKIKGGSILAPAKVASILKSNKIASDLYIGKMPLVKDTETRHFLICGATGSGKTNLIDTLLPQVERRNEPAIIIDQTGEMIAKYYDPDRGDIIFNPLDARSHDWDFWADCFDDRVKDTNINTNLEKFAKILFGFNRRSSSSSSDPFWENSAETIFVALVNYAKKEQGNRVQLLQNMLSCWSLEDLEKVLIGTPASRYLAPKNKVTANSILSVMTTLTKPLNYLTDPKPERSFSLHKHLDSIGQGNKAWLFLATKPSQRELTLPLIACLLELAISLLVENGIQKERKLWFVLDELASLGKLPALNGLMSEGRKYGACVIAAMQSLNQL